MDISMMIVFAAMFVVQCDRKWSNNVPITDGSRYNVTLQDMSHLSSRNASAPVTLVILHIDTVNFAFHYCTVLSRVLMELVIAMYTMNAHEHGVKVLCLVRVVSFAYFLQLWKAPFGFLFTYNRGSVLLKAWVGFSGSSVQSSWNSWKKTFHWLNLPEYIFECTSALFVKAWEWNLTMFTFMTESPPADATVQTSKMPVDMVMTVFMTQVSEITTIIRTNIVMICIMLLLIIWMSAPYENEGARRLFRRYIFNPKLPWLLSASNTRYLHLICVAVSGLVYYESWGLNRSPDKLSHTPLSFLQMSIADTIIAACIVFLCFMSRILQFFFPRVGISINMSPDSVLQLGSSSEDGYDVVLVTSTTQTVFGNLDRKDYYVETIAFPCKLDLCVKEIMQVFAEPIQRLPIEAACIGFAEDGVLTLLSKEHSSERSKKPVLSPVVAARAGRYHTVVIHCCVFALGAFVPWGAIIATCSQSVGTARHSFSGFMAWGNTTATSTPPAFGPQEDPANNRANAKERNGATGGPGAQENKRSDHTERNGATGGPGAQENKSSDHTERNGARGGPGAQENSSSNHTDRNNATGCPVRNSTGSNNHTNSTNNTQTLYKYQQWLERWTKTPKAFIQNEYDLWQRFFEDAETP